MSTVNCNCCGIAKDPTQLEVYPWGEEDAITDTPIEPLLDIHVDSKLAMVCFVCFHRIQPDMWIEERHWAAENPTVPYAQLPDRHRKEDRQ